MDSSNFHLEGDPYKAAYFWLNKVGFRGTIINERGRVFFRFVPSDRIQDLILDFAGSTGANVDAKQFAEAHKFFIDQIREARNGGGAK